MSLQYDSARKTAMDSASGLGVEFLENDHPQEAQSLFRLYWNGQAYLFTVHFDFGYNDLAHAHPGMSNNELLDLMNKKNTITYFPGLVVGIQDKSIVLDRVDIFLELLALVLRDQWPTTNVHIIFSPWQVDKSLHRDIRYSPIRAPIWTEWRNDRGCVARMAECRRAASVQRPLFYAVCPKAAFRLRPLADV